MRILDRGIAVLGAALVLGGVALAMQKQGTDGNARGRISAERRSTKIGDSKGTSSQFFLLESTRDVDANGDPVAVVQSDVVAIEVAASGKIASRRVVGSVPRSPRGSVRGVVDGAGTVFVVANEEDRDFGASLYKVDGGRVIKLTDGALRGSRPLVANGAVYTELGAEGPVRSRPPANSLGVASRETAGPLPQGAAGDGEVRVDDLQVAAFDASGAKSIIYAGRAFALHLAGTDRDGDLLIYDVRPDGAAIVTVTRQGRVLRRDSVEPFARDFTRDGERLVFANHTRSTPDHETPWTVEALDLVHHTQTVLHEERAFQPAPFAFDGTTWFTASSPENGNETRMFRGRVPAPIAGGQFTAMEAIDAAGAHALVRHEEARGDRLMFVDLNGATETPLDEDGTLRTVLGFAGGEVVR
jgi:hypothetical protein